MPTGDTHFAVAMPWVSRFAPRGSRPYSWPFAEAGAAPAFPDGRRGVSVRRTQAARHGLLAHAERARNVNQASAPMKYLSCLACLALGCSGVGATPPIEAKVNVRAQTSDGVPLAGVLLESSGRQAVSAADGTAHLTLSGSEGERREVSIVCPDDYETTASTLVVSIHRSNSAARAYHYDVACNPLRRSIVVVTRAVNGANLPILHLGSEIGRTNEAGIAHAWVSLPAGESLRLMLDTDDRDLLPRSPTFDFPAADRDEIVTINQLFDVPVRPKVSRRPAKKATTNRPTRL